MNRKQITELVRREFSAKRTRRIKEENELRYRLYSEHPELGALRAAPDMVYIEAIRANLTGSVPLNEAEIQRLVKQKQAERDAGLAALGLSEADFHIAPDCALCEDKGEYHAVRENPNSPIVECECFHRRVVQLAIEMSGMTKLPGSFEQFEPMLYPNDKPVTKLGKTQRESAVVICSRLRRYAEEFPNTDRRTLLFMGRVGLGKTFMMNSLCRAITEKGYYVAYYEAYSLFDELFTKSFRSDPDIDIAAEIIEADVLAIDDLGTELQRNNFNIELLFRILNEREREQRFTFISTNLSVSELRERYSDRITSRLMNTDSMLGFAFVGEDLRKIIG